jgi:hypothetical protein
MYFSPKDLEWRQFLVVGIFILFSTVSSSPVENTGVIKVNLNAERVQGVWLASGSNGTGLGQ